MANQRDINKKILGVYVDREIYQRVTKLARTKRTNVAELIRTHIERMVEGVQLTAEEKRQIKQERQKFEAKQKATLAKKRTFPARLQSMRNKLEPR